MPRAIWISESVAHFINKISAITISGSFNSDIYRLLEREGVGGGGGGIG